MKQIFLILLLLQTISYCQISTIKLFPHSKPQTIYYNTVTTSTPNGTLFQFWTESNKIYFSKSTDNGGSWSDPSFILQHTQQDSNVIIDAAASLSGRVFLLIKLNTIQMKYSDDYGETWSVPTGLPTGNTSLQRLQSTAPITSFSTNGDMYVLYIRGAIPNSTIYRIKSTDNGITWSEESVLSTNSFYPSLVSLGGGNEMLFFMKKENSVNQVYSISSTDYGISWTLFDRPVLSIPGSVISFKANANNSNKITLVYDLPTTTPFDGFFNNEIEYISSTDGGWVWSEPQKFTTYKGYDGKPHLHLFNNKPFVSFISKRSSNSSIYYPNYTKIWYGIAGESNDVTTPPYVYRAIRSRTDTVPSIGFIKAFIDDDLAISSVKLIYSHNNQPKDSLLMFDDGFHNDSLANDKIYGIHFPGLEMGDVLNCSVKVTDADNQTVLHDVGSILIPLEFSTDRFLIDVNRFKMPISNAGVMADILVDGVDGGRYDGHVVFFSAGFYLSGYSNSNMWTNAVATASRVQDYEPGVVGSYATNPKNIIYIVAKDDSAFGESWQQWKPAVTQGADFYDGNNDGIYTPIDYNNNGIWDTNEDKPDILGDVTTFCVYNENVPSNLRRFIGVEPQGIEVQQTVFAYSDSSVNTLNNTIFVRYRIINKGIIAPVMDSVYFSFWADQDVGEYTDDLVGSDTILNAGFVYQNAPDNEFGNAAPTVLTTILQGPVSYLPGETFIDNNNNGLYDDGIDIPLDTAYSRRGKELGIKIYPGAKNMNMSSFMHNMSSHPTQGDPSTKEEARNYMLGGNKFGDLINPCNWPFGVVGEVNCTEINPLFLYSGNPVTNYGWINTIGMDQRTVLNVGPFTLHQNEPVEIMGALLVGRKDDPFSSFYEARRIASYVRSFYKSNFGEFPLGVENEQINNVKNFELFQNYPNPFNPVTTIKYQIPEAGLVSLKVYNILGEEVATLVNEIKRSGSYTIDFNAGKLASGIYIYELKTSFESISKKLIILK
jgi:hypothetical protein